jgi:hypothetical protein
MAIINDLLESAVQTPSVESVALPPPVPVAVQQRVTAATEAKRGAMGAPDLTNADAYRFAAGRATGAGRASMGPLETELATLTPNQIRERYGDDEGNRLIRQQLQGIRDFRSDTRGTRNDEEIASDLVSGVGLGVANSVGGIAALAGGAISDRLGVEISNRLQGFTRFVQGTQSPTLQNRRRAIGVENELDFRDNTARFEEESRTQGSTIAGLRRFGRDALDAVGNTIADPTTLSDGVAQGVGSLLTGGPIGRGLSAIGRAALPSAALSRAPSGMSVAIGGMEAGGAYQQTASEIAGMSFDQLEANSPYYRELREQGLSPEEARTRAAGRAGLMAAGITAPAAMAAGGLVSRFEAAPLRVPNLRTAARNLVTEPVEEGIQGATGQVAQNLATQQFADETRTISEGVGEQAGTGALFGLGTAGAIQAPGAVGRAALGSVEATGRTVLGALAQRHEANRARNEAASPVADSVIQRAGAEVAANAPQTEAALAEAVAAAPPEAQPAVSALAEKILNVSRFDPAMYENTQLPEQVRQALSGSTHRVEALQRLAQVVNKVDPKSPDAIAAAVTLYELLGQYEDVVFSDEAALEAISDEHPAGRIIGQFNALIPQLQQNPAIQRALARMQEQIAEVQAQVQAKPITPESLATPEGQQQAQNIVGIAQIAPHKGNLEATNMVLMHAEQGRIQLTDSQRSALMASKAILEAAKKASDEQKALGHKRLLNDVSDQIQVDPDPNAPKLSAVAHYNRIAQAMRAGNTKLAASHLKGFGEFVQHMANKVGALNQHFAQGGGRNVSYQALNPTTREWYQDKAGLAVHPHNAGSVELAQRVQLEAQRLAEIYEGLRIAFPALNGEQIQVPTLNQDLQGNPYKVVQAFQKGERVRPGSKPKAEAKPVDSRSGETKPVASQKEAKAIDKPEAKPKAEPKKEEPKAAAVAEVVSTPQAAEATTEAAAEAKPAKVKAEPRNQNNPFKDSVIQGEVYHATKNPEDLKNIQTERENSGANFWLKGNVGAINNKKIGFYTTRNISYAAAVAGADIPQGAEKLTLSEYQSKISEKNGVSIVPLYVNLTNPYLVKDDDSITITSISRAEMDDLVARGYDGLLFADPEHRYEEIVVFRPEQVSFVKPEAPLQGMDAAYPKLIGSEPGSKVVNWFKRAFKLPKEAKTHTIGTDTPLDDAIKAVDAAEDTDIAKAYRGYLRQGKTLAKIMDARLQRYLANTPKTGDNAGKPLLERFLSGQPANSFADGKPLNITEPDGKTLRYNQELLEGAILAGLQWLLTADQRESQIDKKAASALTGIPEDEIIDEETLIGKLSNKGLPTVTAKRTLADKILQFWGLETNADVPDGYAEGIPEAMAAEVMEALLESGDLILSPVRITDEDGLPQGETKTLNFYEAKAREKDDPILKSPSSIEKMVLIEPEDVTYFGDARPKVAATQLRNPAVRNTPEQKAMIRKEQETPHYLNVPMVKLYEALGLDNLLGLFGAGNLEGRVLNKNHAASLDGQNRTISAAFHHLTNLVTEVGHAAEKAGVEQDQLPIHYAYNVNRVGRLQMLGRYNPQSTKLVREAILPTRSTLDLSNENSTDYRKFALGLAQALGVKVHKKKLDAARKDLDKLLSGPLAPAVEMLRDFHNTGKVDPRLVEVMKSGLKNDLTVMALHAVAEYARLQETQDRSSFTTSIYVEADGVTNGPVNAMMLLTSGRFTKEWVNRMAKGGLFFRGPRTMNEQHGDGYDTKDMYQTTTDNLADEFAKLTAEIDSPQVQEQLNLMKDLMDLFLPDFEIQDGKLVMNRGIAKNPLTITIYGSGEKGIAGKVTSAMIEQLYERMSEVAAKLDENPKMAFSEAMFGSVSTDLASAEAKLVRFSKAFKALTTNVVARRKGKLELSQGENVEPMKGFDAKTFTVDKARLTNLRTNMQHLFVKPLREAITQTIGQPLMESAKLVQQATQIQSIFQQHTFNEAVRAKIAEKVAQDPRAKADGLSRQERDDILSDVLKRFPLVETGRQSFFIAGSQSTDVNASEWSKSLTGHIGTNGFVYGPTDAGVAGIPMMVIGTGDGQMMQTLATMKGAPTGSLKIFDGVNFPLDKLEDSSRKANQAVFDAWQGNPIQAVSLAFSESIPSFPTADYPGEMLNKLGRTLGIREPTYGAVAAAIQDLDKELRRAGISVEARHSAIARVSHSIDQMAAASSPYEHKGIELQGTNEEEISEELNKLYLEELDKLMLNLGEKPGRSNIDPERREQASAPVKEPATKPKPVTETPATKPVSVKTKPAIEPAKEKLTFGRVDPKSKVRILSPTAINKIAKKLGLAPAQQTIFDQIHRTGAAKDYRVIYGTVEQLSDYAEEKGLTLPMRVHGAKGVTVPGESTIYLISPSRETLVHELIHAATYEKVEAVLDGRLKDQEAELAVGRLLQLQDQFLALNDDSNAYAFAKSAIHGHQIGGRPAAALNEFMAWGLANKDLAETMSKTKASPLVQLAKDVFQAIKRLVFGRAKVSKPEDDMLSNLLFNTSIIVRSQPSLQSQVRDATLFMSTAYGDSERLAQINATFDKQVVDYLNTNPVDRIDRQGKVDLAILGASRLVNSVVSHGFAMTPQELTTFQAVTAALATEAAIDPNSMAMAQSLYAHVTKTLKVEDFMADPDSLDPADRYQAQEKFDTVMGNFLVETDGVGRSSLLPVFLGLAMVNDPMRTAMAKIALPKTVLQGWNTLDGVLENAGNIALESLSQRISGIDKAANVQEAVDALSRRIQEVSQERQTLIDQLASPVGGLVDRANQIIVDGLNALAARGVSAAERLDAKHQNKLTQGLAASARVTAAIVNEDQAEKVAQGVMTMMNNVKGLQPIRELVVDLIGRTSSNMNVYDLIKRTRSDVQQDRQQFREHLPTIIAGKFSRKLTDAEWSTLFRGMGKTDLAALARHFTPAEILTHLEDETQLDRSIRSLESTLSGKDQAHWSLLQRKAKQLAHYMGTGEPGSNLLRNAEAVSRLLGERTQKGRVSPDRDFIADVDQLVTLYALKNLSTQDRESMASLAQDEAQGMEFTLAYLVGQRVEEQRKAASGRARLNHYKGHIPSTQQDGVSLIVADDDRYVELVEKSYVRVGDYGGSAAEGSKNKQSYYFAPVSARSPFNQGIMQNVRATASGVEASTGFTDGLVAGRIADPASVALINRRLHQEKGGTRENLLPVFNETGEVVAFERSVDPAHLDRLNRDTHLAKMIGVWRGRQVEEAKAGIYNEKLIDALHSMHQEDVKASSGNQSQYVDLFDTKRLDPVLRDAVSLMSKEVRDHARSVFGGEAFYVRRDMLNDALGYRNASIGDAWTGISHWTPAKQEQVKRIALGVMGNDAYRYLMNSEKTIQNVVKDARLLIVVKSMVVPAANFVSNIYQMMSRGVPLMDIARGLPKKTAEIHAYTKSRLREIEAEADLRAAEAAQDVVQSRKLKAEIQSIQDSYRRMSIWPLIEVGEFSSISDVGISRDEILLSEGRWHQYMERLTEKLPDSLRTAGRYALVTKDTALFQGMQKAVEYGDFLAKAIIYDDITVRQKKPKKYALGRVTEEFVNYDRLPGRFRGALEANGLLWFYHFKIRAAKIALSTIRNNPVHALLANVLPSPPGLGSVGTPLTDNLFTKGLEGTLGHSIGPGMGFGAFRLNPWLNLAH